MMMMMMISGDCGHSRFSVLKFLVEWPKPRKVRRLILVPEMYICQFICPCLSHCNHACYHLCRSTHSHIHPFLLVLSSRATSSHSACWLWHRLWPVWAPSAIRFWCKALLGPRRPIAMLGSLKVEGRCCRVEAWSLSLTWTVNHKLPGGCIEIRHGNYMYLGATSVFALPWNIMNPHTHSWTLFVLIRLGYFASKFSKDQCAIHPGFLVVLIPSKNIGTQDAFRDFLQSQVPGMGWKGETVGLCMHLVVLAVS